MRVDLEDLLPLAVGIALGLAISENIRGIRGSEEAINKVIATYAKAKEWKPQEENKPRGELPLEGR